MTALVGRVAFVTGGGRGIGWAVAERLAADGADVAIGGHRDAAALQARADQLAARHGVRTLAIAGDVGDAAAVAASYQTIWKTWKRLDVLVNNAGVMEHAVIGMITAEHVDRVLGTNTRGAILHLQAAARLMARERRGTIINLTSILASRGAVGQAVYAASKAAVIGLTMSAAKELAPQGIRVNAVAPGYIDTELTQALSAEVRAERLAQIGLGRIGTPDDVAGVVGFLASDAAAYVTGQVLGVDGGMVI